MEVMMKANLVKDWMTRDPITISSNLSIPEAYWIMVENKIRRLLVLEDGKLIGIVTIEDLRQKIPFTNFAVDAVRASDLLSHCPVSKVMSHNPKKINPDTSLVVAAQTMLDQKISTLPVLDGQKIVGIITESDIFRAFVKMHEEEE
jgi:acetoin utilization protein AcuB